MQLKLHLGASSGGLAILATALLPSVVLGALDLTKSYKLEAETSPGHWTATKIYPRTVSEHLSVLALVLEGPSPDQLWTVSTFNGKGGAYKISPVPGGTTLSDLVPGGAITAWDPTGTNTDYGLVLPGQSAKFRGVRFDAPAMFHITGRGRPRPRCRRISLQPLPRRAAAVDPPHRVRRRAGRLHRHFAASGRRTLSGAYASI